MTLIPSPEQSVDSSKVSLEDADTLAAWAASDRAKKDADHSRDHVVFARDNDTFKTLGSVLTLRPCDWPTGSIAVDPESVFWIAEGGNDTSAETWRFLGSLGRGTTPQKKRNQYVVAALVELDKNRDSIGQMRAFLENNEQKFAGLTLSVWVVFPEIEITNSKYNGDADAKAIAARFPGEWTGGVKDWRTSDGYRDWVAIRDGVKIRISSAERIYPAPDSSRLMTF